MDKKIFNCNEGCPVESTLQFIKGKWKSVILYYLIQNKICHFGYLNQKLQKCSTRVLALQLKELEQDNIIKKKVYMHIPPKTEYTLTDFGNSFKPVIMSIHNWGKNYNKYKENII